MSAAAYGAVFAAAFLLSLALAPLSRALALRLRAVDRGGGRRAHEGLVPRLGGLGLYAAWAAVTVAALLILDEPGQERRLTAILLGSLLLLAMGCRDDARGVGVKAKLATQVTAAVLVAVAGVRIEVLTNPVGGMIRPGLLELPLTVLWLVAVTNAYNLIDGMDGLAATAGAGICVAMALLYAGPGLLGPLAIVALAGALLGFLRHNFPPATIFMGDSGSQSVGFLLGSLSLVAFAKATTLAALLVPIVAFGHPLVDLAYAVLRRYHRGLPLGLPDREHLHHKLLDRGYSRRAALGILVLANLGLLALVVPLAQRRLSGWVVILALLTVPVGIALRIARHVWRGGSVREEALAFFASREQRYVLHLGRQFRRSAAGAGDLAQLEELVRGFVRDAGLLGVAVEVRGAGARLPALRIGGGCDGACLSVRLPLAAAGGAEAVLEVSAGREGSATPTRAAALEQLADGVRSFLVRRPESWYSPREIRSQPGGVQA